MPPASTCRRHLLGTLDGVNIEADRTIEQYNQEIWNAEKLAALMTR